jgi:colicin import membrane protein
MSTTVEPQTSPPPEKEDPWRLGWRYLPEVGPDGKTRYKQVPLTQDDLLHPQEEDFIVNNGVHDDICTYLRNALFAHFAGRPDVVVLHDYRVDWGVEGVQPLGPDFSVFDNVRVPWDRMRGTFYVAELDARPLLAIEVTSPTTRKVDLDEKVDLYFRACIPYYAIVDPRPLPKDGYEILLMGYQFDSPKRRKYHRDRLDERGRLWLETIGLWLAPEGEVLACYDEQGRRLMEHVEAVQAVQQAQLRVETAEARLKEMEAELQRLRQEKKP